MKIPTIMHGSRLTDIIRPKQNFGDRKPLIVHEQNLIRFSDDIVRMPYPPLSVCREIGEYIFLNNGITLGVLSSRTVYSGTADRVHEELTDKCRYLGQIV